MVYLWLFKYFWKDQHLSKSSLYDILNIAIKSSIKILKKPIINKLYYSILCLRETYYGKKV